MTGPHPLAAWLERLDSFVRLSGSDKAAILDLPVHVGARPAHHRIVREGQPIETCAVLMSGYAIRYKRTMNGARSIIGVLLPADAVDLQHLYLKCADHDVEMLTPGRLALLDHRDLRAVAAERPAIATAFSIHNQLETAILREWLLNVSRRPARQRMAHLICELALRCDRLGLGVEGGFDIPCTQQQLGDALGLTSVHVNRTLRGLEDDGLVEREQHVIRVPDWSMLARVAEFNAVYLHMLQPRSTDEKR